MAVVELALASVLVGIFGALERRIWRREYRVPFFMGVGLVIDSNDGLQQCREV
jgi:hypothetical protein